MAELHHWKTLGEKNPDYIGAFSFQPGEKKIVTILSVEERNVRDPNGAQHKEMVCVLAEEKPLICNKTNAKMIQKVLGSGYIENWINKRIVLAVETVSAFGERVDAVRVQKEKPPAAEKCSDCGQIICSEKGMNPLQIAEGTRRTYGRPLCWSCSIKAKGGKT